MTAKKTHVLVAVDGSAASARAVRVAGQIAGAMGARVSVLHVGQAGEPEAEASDRLAQSELAAVGVGARVEVRGGDAADEILAAARSLPADLLVMGSRGRSQLAGLLLGSVSQDVVPRASCPVLLVRAGAETTHPPRSILLAIEGMAGSEPLAAITARLAKALNAKVTVVHVSYPGGEELERSLYHARQSHGEQAVAAAVAALGTKGIDATPMQLVSRRGISRELADYANAIDADLIVIGSHISERNGANATTDVSTGVSHRTKRPVLITRERPKQR
jgi:nucleotide-binding universal stress UspA family protein